MGFVDGAINVIGKKVPSIFPRGRVVTTSRQGSKIANNTSSITVVSNIISN